MKLKPNPKLLVIMLDGLTSDDKVKYIRACEATVDAFSWWFTPQGDDYWASIHFRRKKIDKEGISYLKKLLRTGEY